MTPTTKAKGDTSCDYTINGIRYLAHVYEFETGKCKCGESLTKSVTTPLSAIQANRKKAGYQIEDEKIKELEERIKRLEQQPKYYPPIIIQQPPYIPPMQTQNCPICHMVPPMCPGYHVTY